jgi:uncharacterized membrane protein
MKNRTVFLLFLPLILAGPACAQFQFTLLDHPGFTLTNVRGINNRGDIAGAYRITPPRHALLISKGQYIPLAPNTILGSHLSEAFKINNHGDVVGNYAGDDGNIHGFLLTKSTLTTLDFPGANDTYPWGINDRGTVVGFWDTVDASGNLVANHGFTWKDGVFTQFDFPGAADTEIFGINDRGEMVGGWDPGGTSPTEHGFVCSKESCLSFDVPVPGATATQGDDISVNGVVVGTYADSNGVNHGFRASASNFTTLDFPGATATLAWGINAHGHIVGNYVGSDGKAHAFLATHHEGAGRSDDHILPER